MHVFSSPLSVLTPERSGNSYAKVSFDCTCSGTTYTKTVKIQRLALPLSKEDRTGKLLKHPIFLQAQKISFGRGSFQKSNGLFLQPVIFV